MALPAHAANPMHTYLVPGTYTVTLSVSGIGGETTILRRNWVTATASVPIHIFLPLVMRQ